MYTVSWDINIEAESMKEAAKIALEIQRDPDSIATTFVVVDGLKGKGESITL